MYYLFLTATRRRFASCSFLFFLVVFLSNHSTAQVIDRVVQVQPIQVCNDAGGSCANPSVTLFEAEVDKIWQQAGIDVQFKPVVQFNSTLFQNIMGAGEPTLFNLAVGPGHGQNPDGNVLNLWFVNDVEGLGGIANVGFNGMALDSAGFSRRDGIAHELGHNLGLSHVGSPANNLMLSSPAAPGSINDIYPDGLDRSFLDAGQISTARSSGFVFTAVPEPEETMALVGALLGIWVVGRKLRAARAQA
jgi:hypothetical protein